MFFAGINPVYHTKNPLLEDSLLGLVFLTFLCMLGECSRVYILMVISGIVIDGGNGVEQLKRSKFAIISLLSGILAPGVVMQGSRLKYTATEEAKWQVFDTNLIVNASLILAVMALIFGVIALTHRGIINKIVGFVGASLGILYLTAFSLFVDFF